MKTAMNKQLYNFAQAKIQHARQGGQIKNSALATKLHKEYNFGQLDLNKHWLSFSLENILTLCEEIQSTLGLDIRQDPYPTKVERLSSAATDRNEKENSYAVSKDFILINSLSELKVNQDVYKISPLTSLGSYIKANEIISVEHTAIVLVENLTVMANLSLLNLSSLSKNIDLTQALWLYRGDVKAQQTTHTSYQFFRQFKGIIPLVCFSDLDPKGIEIALTSHADYWLTLENKDEIHISLSGNEREWFKQGAAITFLNGQIQQIKQDDDNENKHTDEVAATSWQSMFSILLKHKKTLKQEHMLTHKLALTMLKINNTWKN